MWETGNRRRPNAAECLSRTAPVWRFVEDDSRWPIEPGELAALIDLGMTDAQIADYFGQDLRQVESLLERYGLS